MNQSSEAPPLDEPPPEVLAGLLTVEEANIVLEAECPTAIDVSLSELVWFHRGEGAKTKLTRRCTANVVWQDAQTTVARDNWTDVLDEVCRHNEGSRQRSA